MAEKPASRPVIQTEENEAASSVHDARPSQAQSDTLLAPYEGPLPLPVHIDQYNQVLPGAAERIFAMAEAEQRSRLSIAQNESLVATDLARREMALQETVLRRRLNLEVLGSWLGFATTVFVVGAAFAIALFAPEKVEKVGSLMIGFLYAAAQVVAAYRRNVAKPAGEASKNVSVPPSKNVAQRRKH